MSIARWKALAEQAKTIWDTMEDNDKTLILALQEHRKASPKSDPASKISFNQHITQDTPSDEVDDMLLAMVHKHSNRSKPNSHPADVRSVLSQAAKRQTRFKSRTTRSLLTVTLMCVKSISLTISSTVFPKLLVASKVLSLIEEPMEALPVVI